MIGGFIVLGSELAKSIIRAIGYQPRNDVSLAEIENEFSEVEKHNIAVLRRCRDAKVVAARRPERRAIRGEPVYEPDAQRTMRGVLQGISDALGNP